MDGVTLPISELTEEQRRVVALATESQAFVVAGPGTGKTFALIHRADELVRRGVPASHVLVLSFTNAVVGELRRRLAQMERSDAAYVRPVTIDAFAGRIVAGAGDEPEVLGFDDTVRRATSLVRGDAEGSHVTRYQHVIVDEAQDLVGCRLDFVGAVLAMVGGGFTVLGDPAQGIYGFSERAGNPSTGIDALRAAFPTAPTMRLTHDHRSLRDDAAPGQPLRDVVLNADGGRALTALARGLQNGDRLTVPQLATVLRRADSSTGVLCRNNGEVLILSGLLAEARVRHAVRRAATDARSPAWVAEMFADVSGPELSRNRFAELVARDDEWVHEAWKALRRLAGSGSNRVDLRLLRERLPRLCSEEAPDDLSSVPVLSTVHRSKGLEYDTVVVLEPGSVEDDDDAAEEARVLYVAMTRARRRTVRLARPEFPGKLLRRQGRWAITPWRGRGTLRIEVRPGDVSPLLDAFDAQTAQATQSYLREHVCAGDAVTLRRLEVGSGYAVEHAGHRIGTTADTFAPFGGQQPTRIDGVRVDALRSASGDPSRTENLGIGSAGFWLVPEIVGLGRLTWEDRPK